MPCFRLQVAALSAFTALLTIVPASAQIFFSDTVTLNFTRPPAAPELSWNDQMELTPAGLGTLPPWAPKTSRNFWLRTPPLAAGPSWRPPTILRLDISLDGLELAQDTTPAHILAYARYSADRVHWSSWFPLEGADHSTMAPSSFAGRLSIPRAAREQYDSLMSRWWRTSPPWPSDEHEFCVWLAAHHRSFFDAEIPFIGYVQALLEGNAQGLRLRGMAVTLAASGSSLEGVSLGPPRPQRPTYHGKWFFDLSKNR